MMFFPSFCIPPDNLETCPCLMPSLIINFTLRVWNADMPGSISHPYMRRARQR